MGAGSSAHTKPGPRRRSAPDLNRGRRASNAPDESIANGGAVEAEHGGPKLGSWIRAMDPRRRSVSPAAHPATPSARTGRGSSSPQGTESTSRDFRFVHLTDHPSALLPASAVLKSQETLEGAAARAARAAEERAEEEREAAAQGPAGRWRQARIFVSSTEDARAEREAVLGDVVPRLNEWGRPHHLHFEASVPSPPQPGAGSSRRGEALPALEEIDRCRPFFVAVVGSRYGAPLGEYLPCAGDVAAPDLARYGFLLNLPRGLSLAALELEYGAAACAGPAAAAFVRDLEGPHEEAAAAPLPAGIAALRARAASCGAALFRYAYRAPATGPASRPGSFRRPSDPSSSAAAAPPDPCSAASTARPPLPSSAPSLVVESAEIGAGALADFSEALFRHLRAAAAAHFALPEAAADAPAAGPAAETPEEGRGARWAREAEAFAERASQRVGDGSDDDPASAALREIVALLLSSGAREPPVWALVGPSGSGKSQVLGAAVAELLRARGRGEHRRPVSAAFLRATSLPPDGPAVARALFHPVLPDLPSEGHREYAARLRAGLPAALAAAGAAAPAFVVDGALLPGPLAEVLEAARAAPGAFRLVLSCIPGTPLHDALFPGPPPAAAAASHRAASPVALPPLALRSRRRARQGPSPRGAASPFVEAVRREERLRCSALVAPQRAGRPSPLPADPAVAAAWLAERLEFLAGGAQASAQAALALLAAAQPVGIPEALARAALRELLKRPVEREWMELRGLLLPWLVAEPGPEGRLFLRDRLLVAAIRARHLTRCPERCAACEHGEACHHLTDAALAPAGSPLAAEWARRDAHYHRAVASACLRSLPPPPPRPASSLSPGAPSPVMYPFRDLPVEALHHMTQAPCWELFFERVAGQRGAAVRVEPWRGSGAWRAFLAGLQRARLGGLEELALDGPGASDALDLSFSLRAAPHLTSLVLVERSAERFVRLCTADRVLRQLVPRVLAVAAEKTGDGCARLWYKKGFDVLFLREQASGAAKDADVWRAGRPLSGGDLQAALAALTPEARQLRDACLSRA
eukprot:tig00020723_g13485.t1